MIELRTFGGVELVNFGVPVRLATKKHLGLLVYLALHQGRAFRRGQLAELLWEPSNLAHARHSLSHALYSLRNRLAGLRFDCTLQDIRLPTGLVEVDALEFISAVDAQDWNAVSAIYLGEFLEGFWVEQANGFEDWLESERIRFRRFERQALNELLSRADAGGDWRLVESLCQRLLASDPFDEVTHRVRLRALAAAGEHSMLREESAQLIAFFEKELRRRPDAETLTLIDHLQSSRAKISVGADLDDFAPQVSFVGRTAEFDTLRQQWEKVKGRIGVFVTICGEAGIGKTRLCTQFLRLAAVQGARVLQGRCYATESQIPYSGAVDALVGSLRQSDLVSLSANWLSVIAELLPELSPDTARALVPALEGEGARRRLFEGLAQLLESMSREFPVILFLDDFHWADDSTAALVHYLVRRLRNYPIMIMIAVRNEDISMDSAVGKLLRNARHDNSSEIIPVGELEAMAAFRLMEEFTHRKQLDLSTEVFQCILSRAGGRPFFIIETLNALQYGANRDIADLRNDAGSLISPLPASVEEFLGDRIRGLGRHADEIVAALAVLGRHALGSIVMRVAGLSENELAHGLAELERKGFVRNEGPDISFSHDLLRETAYRQLGGLQRRMLHGRAAEILEALGYTPTGNLAVHHDLAGNRHLAYEHAVRAAEASEKVYAPREAEFYLRMALANTDDPGLRRTMNERIAAFLYRWARFAEADQYYSLLVEGYVNEGNKQGVLCVEINRMCLAIKKRSLPLDHLIENLQALAVIAEEIGDQDRLSEILIKLAETVHDTGHADEISAIAARLVKSAEQLPAGYHSVRALCVVANVIGMYKSTSEARHYTDLAVRQAIAGNAAEELVNALRARAKNSILSGLLQSAEDDLIRAQDLATRMGFGDAVQDILLAMGVLRIECGQLDAAEECFQQVILVAEETDAAHERMIAYVNLMLVQFELHDLVRARDFAGTILSWRPTTGPWWCIVTAWSILGLCAVERGNLTEAHRCRREVLLRFEGRNGSVSDASYAEAFLARLAVMEGESEAALERLERAIAAYEGRDVCCRLRLQLERARALEELDPREAWRQAGEVRTRAKEVRADPLVAKADAILDRLPTPIA